MEIVVREMRAEDLGRVHSILAGWNMAPVPASMAIPHPELAAIPVDTTFVASIGDTIVGVGSYVMTGSDRGETLLLAVDPAHRGTGVGWRLQTARLVRMKSLGVTRVITDADRPETIDWYVRNFGYRVVGTRPKRHPFGFEEADAWTVLELDLRTWSPRPPPQSSKGD